MNGTPYNSKYQEIIYTICTAIPFQISGNHLHYLQCHTIPNIRKSSTLFAMPYHSKYQEIIYTICNTIPFQISGNHSHYLQRHTIPNIKKSSSLFATPYHSKYHSKYEEIIYRHAFRTLLSSYDQKGSYELGSVSPSILLSKSFLGIGSLVFSKTQHSVRGPCVVVRGRAGFFEKKYFCPKNG